MGAGASTGAAVTPSAEDVGKWSKEEVGKQVAAIGPAFEPYKDIVMNEAIDGQTLLEMDEGDLEEMGVTKKMHRKRLLKMVEETKCAPAAPACTPAPEQPTTSAVAASVRRFSARGEERVKLFMSYPRGEQTTPFARQLKIFLEERGFGVWMDEEGIRGGADFMHAIGSAIQASRGIVAIIDNKFCGSTYCNNELAMAQGNNLQLFPILFRGLRFDAMPAGLQYMLASTNVIPFPDAASDSEGMAKMHEHMCSIFNAAPATGPRRHGDAECVAKDTAADGSSDSVPKALAPIPITVPDLPDVVCEREDVLSGMIGCLLGFMGTGAVTLSSVKKKGKKQSNKLSSHGQGGAGKTTLAAMLVRNDMVQRAFDRIGWVSVGQTPDIMELQRALYCQLTGEVMEPKPTAEQQLDKLKEASAGKRWLVVLDDTWDANHEKLLNCIDVSTTSKLFVTTRIRGLLKGCDEISLELLTRDEAVDLLLRTGGVDGDDETCAAADQIANLCGDLPLFVGICGGIIAAYEGALEWQTELIAMLKKDRLEVMGNDDDGEGETVMRVVGTSLAMLQDGLAESVFKMLSLCPEDVPIPADAVQLIWSACLPDHAQKANTIAVRKVCKKLLDRNLLMGSTADGVHLHDIVRDFMRSTFEGKGEMQGKQRCIVQDVIDATPAKDWQLDTALGRYVRQSLRQHMVEALLDDALEDEAAASWLDASDKVLDSAIVCSAAGAVGHKVLVQMAERYEANSEFWAAAKRFASAGQAMGSVAAGDLDKKAMRVELDMKACDAMTKCEPTRQTQTLELALRGSLCPRLGFGHEYVVAGYSRILQIASSGEYDVKQPIELCSIAFGIAFSIFPGTGMVQDTYNTGAWYEKSAALGQWDTLKASLLLMRKAQQMCSDENPFKMVAQAYSLAITTWWPTGVSMAQREDAMQLTLTAVAHKDLQAMVADYDDATHGPAMQHGPLQFNVAIIDNPGNLALWDHGDLRLARQWALKVLAICENLHFECAPGDISLFGHCLLWSVIQHASLYSYRRSGFRDIATRMMHATKLDYAHAETTVLHHRPACMSIGFELDYDPPSERKAFGYMGATSGGNLVPAAKRGHWLSAPDEIDAAEFRRWLPEPECGAGEGSSCAYGSHPEVDVTLFCSFGCTHTGLAAAEVFETLDPPEYENAIMSAEWHIDKIPLWKNPWSEPEAHMVIGRCHAKLGRVVEAEAAFKESIALAGKYNLPFVEMLAIRDYIVYVLDTAGRRDEQMVALGRVVEHMVLPASEYNAVLDCGLDAEEAVAAYQKASVVD